MTSNIKILPSGHEFQAAPRETLLDAALRAGLALNYSCNNGSCGECRARLISGPPPERRFHDYVFSTAEKERGCFLMCSAYATGDMVVEAGEARRVEDIPHQRVTTRVCKIDRLTDDIIALHVRTPRSKTLRFLAGQHVTIHIPGLPPRNKSVASCPCNAMFLSFHVRRTTDDPFAEHVFSELRPNQTLQIEGPYGRFVLDEASPRSVIFLAFETGFAPVKSLVEHAIALEFPNPMRLYWVVNNEGDHYQRNLCRSWADAFENFHFTSVIAGGAANQAILAGAERITKDFPDLANVDVYANGPEAVMHEARDLLLAHGLPEDRLFVDQLERY